MIQGNPSACASVRAAIWIYFWLLFLEGVLRKWFLPSYSDLLFIVRDPVAVLIYLLALRAGCFPWRPAMVVVWIMTVLAVAFSLAGNAPPLVVFFGLRTNFLHLPLVFVMGAALDRDDVLRIGRWLMFLTVPILILMIVQFNAAPDALVNVGVGGGESGQLRGALGRIRPPGPFSFVAGIVMYFSLAAAFTLDGWAQENRRRMLLVVATVATVVAVPISISRSLLFGLLLVSVFGLVGVLRKPRRMVAIGGPSIIALVAILALSNTVYTAAFTTRWDEAQMAGGGDFQSNIVERIVDSYLSPFRAAVDAPLLGHGVGLGTVAGAKLATGKLTFLFAEDELARCVLELGPLLGFAFIGWRFWLACHLLRRAWRRLADEGDGLPWLLTGASVLSVYSAQFGPATTLGFTVFGAGLVLASLNDPVVAVEEEGEMEEAPPEESVV